MVCQLWKFKFSIFYIYHICPHHAHAFFNFLKLWSVFKISPLTSSCTNFTICVIYLSISLMIFPLIMDHIFFFACMHGNFQWDARHCEFYIIVSWNFCNVKCSWALFWDTINWLRNILILSCLKHCWAEPEQPLISDSSLQPGMILPHGRYLVMYRDILYCYI